MRCLQRRPLLLIAALALAACAHETEGPTPAVETIEPGRICTAQFDVTVTLTGGSFTPVVKDSLTDSPAVVMPSVVLVDADGNVVGIPAGGVAFPTDDRSGKVLVTVVPQGLVGPVEPGDPEVAYALGVTNPTGAGVTVADGIVVVPPPRLDLVAPTSGITNTVVTVTVTGLSLSDGAQIQLDSSPAVAGTNVTASGGTQITFDLDLTGVEPGTYDLTVTSAEGCSHTLIASFTVVPEPFPILGVDPPFGCTCEVTTVTITSEGNFVSTPTVEMHPGSAEDPIVDFERVAFLDASTLTAVVPAGAALGTYDVYVRNPAPNSQIGYLEAGFRVVELPVPNVVAIVPGRGTTQNDTPVSIFGESFRGPMRVELLDRDLNVAITIDGITPVSPTQLDTVIPTSSQSGDLPAGPYLVRVTNLDEETYFTFSGFLVTNPAGNLNPFTQLGSMTTARRLLAGASGRDIFGNRYLYGIGGDAGDGGEVLDTVEVVQLSKFGALGPWRVQQNRLNTPRVGASAVAVEVFDQASPFIPVRTYLYVAGGRSAGGQVLDSVERALILSPEVAPRVTDVDIGSGDQAAGTWYYKVSAVLGGDDPDNPDGETLASDEAIITLTDDDGAITLSWEAVDGASAYRVYRTDGPNGASQQEHLIAETTSTSFTDSGEPAGDKAPLGPGATGVFVVEPSAMSTGRWGHQAVITRDASGARFLTALGGKTSVDGGVTDSVERAPLDDEGLLGAFGSNGSTAMGAARAFFSAAVETSDNVAGFPSDGSRIWVAGGIGTNGMTIDSLEESDVSAGGANSGWTTNGKKVEDAAGQMAVITNEKLFSLGGARMANDTSFGQIVNSGRDTEFDANGDITGSINSTANSLIDPRALGVGISGSGFIYFYGGTSDGDDAVSTVEMTF